MPSCSEKGSLMYTKRVIYVSKRCSASKKVALWDSRRQDSQSSHTLLQLKLSKISNTFRLYEFDCV